MIAKLSILLIIVPVLSCFTGCKRERSPDLPPNILFVLIDDLRPEFGCYGVKEIRTPHIDKFASQGVMFTRNYCQVSLCAPSRASMLTGLRNDSLRVWDNGDRFRKINPDVVTIPQYFHEHGYKTVSMGKIFHNFMPDSVSFEEPDLRPDKYKTDELIGRDPESFYYSESLKRELAQVREQRLKRSPGSYGWNYGRSTECAEAPDTALYDGAQTVLAIEKLKDLQYLDKPFFLALGYYRPHLPFVAPKKYWDLYDRDKITLAGNPFLPEYSPVMAMNSASELNGCYDLERVRHPSESKLQEVTARMLRHGYYACVSYIDACFGKLMKALDETGLAENTVVVLWGDHGWKLGDHGSWCKQTNYTIDTRVPLIIRAPGTTNQGVVCKQLTESIDIFPTLCELAGLEIPGCLDGISMVPIMKDNSMPWKTAAFSQFHRRPGQTPDRGRYMGYSMITDRYHYVEWYEWDGHPTTGFAADELYDLQSDPMENINIAGDPDHACIKALLAEKLRSGWPAAVPEDRKLK